MEQPDIQAELIRLFDDFIAVIDRKNRIKGNDLATHIIFEVLEMTGNSRSKIFSESSSWVDPVLRETLLEKGLIQSITSEEGEKYSLSFAGIAHCIQTKYGKTFEEQYSSFLDQVDQKYSTTEQIHLDWKEKLASLSLILLASTSASSAIRLTNNANKVVLTESFHEVLLCLKKFGLAQQKDELKTVSRGETPVSAHMSRLDFLPRKTNHYYVGKDSEYYFDIEKNGVLDEKKLFFLLKRSFEYYDRECNYAEMYKELSRISQRYYPRFLARSVNPSIVLAVLGQLKVFLEDEVYHLQPKLAKSS